MENKKMASVDKYGLEDDEESEFVGSIKETLGDNEITTR